jgi:glycosyltransferase involved in cell wall biosynthesis
MIAARLLRKMPDRMLRFQIAGDGPVRERTERLACDLGLPSDRIEFLGEVARIESVYQDADILVLTSEHEGTPNVILEAMSFGVPVVATNVGGVPEIVPDDCGILVQPNDFQGLLNAATTMVIDDDLRNRMGRRAQEYVRNNHSIGYLQERLKTIYSGLLSKTFKE